MCGATLKPLHLHNPSTSVGNMEVVDRLEMFNFDLLYFIACLVLAHGPRNLVTGPNYLLLPTHVFLGG